MSTIREIIEGTAIDGIRLVTGDPVDIDTLVDVGALPEEFREIT